jgi:hypothetical protein
VNCSTSAADLVAMLPMSRGIVTRPKLATAMTTAVVATIATMALGFMGKCNHVGRLRS